MAQNKKPKQGKRAPTYSADGMAVSLIAGLILIALGVLLLLSVAMDLDHDIFRLLRTLGRGLGGALAIVLPVIPIWGGALIIVATQRKPPVRPFVLGTVLMLLICTIITLLTFYQGGSSLMDAIHQSVLRDNVGDNMSSFLSDAYERGSKSAVGGGFLGMLLAWPLWKLLGGSTVGGGVIAILLALLVFCFLIRLDVKGISASMKTRSADRRVQREQQKLEQQKQELLWQQEQAYQQEQLRIRQEQLRQQQMQQQMQQQRTRPAPQQNLQPDPPDPWSNMMPAGTANWNQTQGRMQPPLVQKVEPRPQKPQKVTPKPQVGFQPTPEETGYHSAPQAMPDAQLESPAKKKNLFRRDKAEEPDNKPRRRGLFGRSADEEETLPGEATQPSPRRQPAGQPQRTAAPVRRSEPVIAQPVPEEEDWSSPDAPAWDQPRTDAPAWNEPAWEEPADEAPAPEPPVQEEPPQPRKPSPRPVQTPAPAPQKPAPQEPLSTDRPVREGSFMARLQAAQAAANAQKNGDAVAAAEPAAPRKSRKDTPSAWSQPDAPAANASWRSGEDQRPARPVARNTAAAPQKPARTWEDTPPWEDVPEAADATPAAPVMPVLSRETPQDSMWQPEIKTPPRRQNMAALADGALMETEEEHPYVFPPMDLLKDPEMQKGINEEEDALRSRRLENTLQSFRVPAKVRHITHGPAISRFELELAPGVKVSKVTDLNRNIAMNMEVKSVRIEAPIPG
ncbi:MAG: DNA translocase FtsK, partial [Aristaeellaceae bacterium]